GGQVWGGRRARSGGGSRHPMDGRGDLPSMYGDYRLRFTELGLDEYFLWSRSYPTSLLTAMCGPFSVYRKIAFPRRRVALPDSSSWPLAIRASIVAASASIFREDSRDSFRGITPYSLYLFRALSTCCRRIGSPLWIREPSMILARIASYSLVCCSTRLRMSQPMLDVGDALILTSERKSSLHCSM